jgi:hypothetical protein
VSSSFFVRRDAPADVAEIVRAVGQPIVWADGNLASLDAWPERSLLLYIPGESSRGVEVVRDADRYQVRVLALSTKADYDLAFSLVEALGGASMVDVEAAGEAPAGEVRARYGGDWMVRDMAAGIVALKTSLEAGHTVSITGPVASLEIDPRAHADAAQWPEILRRAQVDRPPQTDAAERSADDDHWEKLRAEEEALRPAAPEKRGNAGFALAFVPTLLVILLPALATRLVTWPVRSVIRDRKDRRADRRRERAREAILDATEKLRADPDNVDLRNERALRLLEAGSRVAADREFAACLDRLGAGATAKLRPAVLHYNQYIAREGLRMPALARRSLEAAKAAGLETRQVSPTRRWITTFATAMTALFIAIAGLDPD